jgi:hypothetical protein
VVAAAAERCTLLPCPAGTVVSAAELAGWLEGRREALLQALDRVQGRVEFSLRIWDRATAEPPAGGRAYLAHLREERRLRAEARATVELLVGNLAAEVQFTEWTHEGVLRHPVYLGLRDDVAAARVTREDTARPEARDRRIARPEGGAPAVPSPRSAPALVRRARGSHRKCMQWYTCDNLLQHSFGEATYPAGKTAI